MKKYIILILFVITVVLSGSLLFGKTFAKYNSSTSGNVPIGVALFLMDDSIQSIDVPLNAMNPGSTFTYNFYVANYNQLSSRAEVSLDYYIEITRTTNIPFTIRLLSDQVSSNNILLSSGVQSSYQTSNISMNHMNNVVHNYSLIIEWDASYNDVIYKNRLDGITITLHAIQKNQGD